MRIAVIGAGVGGLCAAIRLAARGHDVVVFERGGQVGGKLAALHEGGYAFDLGPGVLTMPHLFDELFALAGSSLAAQVETTRLDPQCRYRWADGSMLDLPDDRARTAAAVDAFSPGAGAAWSEFERRAGEIWAEAERTFPTGPLASRSLVGRARTSLDLRRLDGARTLAKLSEATFDDPRLRQLVNRYASYAGASPYEAPATLASLAHVEQEDGCWHVTGGLAELAARLAVVAAETGVDIRLGHDVGRLGVDGGAVRRVELADGGAEPVDAVVSDVDAAHLYADLLPQPQETKRIGKVKRSMSAFVLCAAVRGRTDGVAHRNVVFPLHDEQEYRYLAADQLAIAPTVTATVSAVTDRSMAPRDAENWVFVVTTPPAVGIDRRLMSAAILNRFAERGIDLRDRVEFTRSLVPADFEARYRAVDGAIHGMAAVGRTGAFGRPANRGPVDGLFLVGGSAHPGPGLPLVAMGAGIVADLIGDG